MCRARASFGTLALPWYAPLSISDDHDEGIIAPLRLGLGVLTHHVRAPLGGVGRSGATQTLRVHFTSVTVVP